MKRLISLLAALCLMLCACAKVPGETTAPPETTTSPITIAPTETTAPAVDNDMSYEDQDLPIADDPDETAATPPMMVRIDDPDTLIYAGPGFLSGALRMVEEAGTYTIVEEAMDSDGNVWGRLKSGAGWVCLTTPPRAPIYADYAPEDFNAYHAYWSEETDYITSIGFTPAETLTDVKFGLLDWFETESWQMSEVLYTMDELDPDRAFLAQVVFWGDMTTYGISFTDADGAQRHFAVSISGKDGSLCCTEYK